MRTFLVSAAIIGLIAGSVPALAQEHHDDKGGGGGAPHAEPHGGGAPHGAPAPHNAPAHPAGGHPEAGHGEAMHGPAPHTAPNMAMHGPEGHPAAGNTMRGPQGRPGPNNAMRGGSAHDFHSVRNYHQNFNAGRRFHAGGYARPAGYYDHHWTWGETLPSLFWAHQYWLMNYGAYDLPPPPFGAVWVRVGGDALLIDQDSGSIIEVDYGVFY